MIKCDKPFDVALESQIRINDFQKLVLIKILRKESLIEGVIQYVMKTLGNKIVENSNIGLKKSFINSSTQIPIIFILSQGCDPKIEFDSFYEEYKL